MLGWVTKAQAVCMGMTHHARLYGLLPCYVGDINGPAPILEFKHPVFALVEYILAPIYMLACQVSGNEPRFAIQLRGRIKP